MNKLGKILGELPAGRYDCHVHVYPGKIEPEKLVVAFAAAGMKGGPIFSENPDPLDGSAAPDPEKAMDAAIEWASGSPTIYQYYWINPVLDNASDLVDMAVEKGMFGFKCLPGRYYPGDEKALPVYEKMAKAGKPVIFHSGILWDGRPSSKFTRPGNYEELIDIPDLRFCLAHVSWPWCEECVAVFGKFLNARTRSDKKRADMFIDVTPGTPRLSRRSALEMIYGFDYDVRDRVMFGTDCMTNRYTVAWAKEWQERDDKIYAALGSDKVDPDSVYRRALQAFLFGDNLDRRLPTPDGTEDGQ